MKKAQKLQDFQYGFPYHYIVKYEPHFTQTKSWQWGINYAATLDLITSKLKPKRYKIVIDVGTGDGRLVHEISQKYPDREVIGIDYSSRAIDMAKALYPEGNFLCKDIVKEKLDIKADVVTLIEVIEHIPPDELKKFIHSVGRLLKKGGSFFITVPHSNMPVQKKHFQHFDLNSLKKLFPTDYKITEVKFLGKQGWRYQLILKLLENEFFVLNHKGFLDKIYKYYKDNIFFCNEIECSRIYLELEKNE